MINMLRVCVLLFGGAVVGIGLPVLWEHTRMWQIMGASSGAKAMKLLLAVNALVLTYITFDVASRWDQGFSWRIPLALSVFACKAAMLLLIRTATQQQENQLARDGKLDRRSTDRRHRDRRLDA